MTRLTEKDGRGNWSLRGLQWDMLTEGIVITREMQQRLYGALCKFKAYEDTGLMPDEVMDGRLLTAWMPLPEAYKEEQ